MATSFKRSHACTTALSAPDPTAGHRWPTSPLETTRHSQASLDHLLWGHRSFLLGSGVHKVLFVPSKSLLPQSCVSSVIKSLWPQSQILWGFSVPLPDPQVGKSVVGPRTFLTVWECLWYNCPIVCRKKLWLCWSQQTVENLQQIGIPDHLTYLLRNLCKSRSNNSNQTWNNRLVPNWEKSRSRLNIVTLFI